MPSDVATNTMMRLPASELMTMRDDFLKEGEAGLTLTQFVRVMLRRGRQAQVNTWTQEANKRRMSGLSLGDRPHFDSDNDDVDDDPEIRDEHGNIMGDVRSAVKRGGSGLSEADAGDWPKLAEALEAKIGTIADGEIGFDAFARIVEGALRRDDEDDV